MKHINHKHDQYSYYILGCLVMSTILSTLILTSSLVSADDVVDNVSITISQSCTMSGTGNNTHTATIDNGTYQANIGTTTMKVLCNDNAGFSIYAIGFTDNKYDGVNHTKLVGTSASNNATIATGTNTSAGNDDTSNWAMKLSTDTTATYPITIQSNYDSYSLVPDTYTKVATRLSGTDVGTNATGSTLTTTYAAYISKTQPADTYTGQVKYTLVHPNTEQPLQPQPSTPGYITYYANAADAVGTMGNQALEKAKDWSSCNTFTDYQTICVVDGQSIDISTLPDSDIYADTITLFASNFSRTGYGFAGWSDSYDYATNPNAKFYGPNETITVPTGTTTNGLSLYAVWIKSQGSIQDQSKVASVCNSLTTAPTDGTANLTSVSALTDQRDNNTYAIAKLADGNCWMIENLRLESTAEHNSDGALAQGYGTSTTYGNFGGLADAESTNFTGSTTANSLYYSGTQEGTASIDIGTADLPAYRMPRYNNLNTSTRASNPTNDDGNMYSYGNYYTWHAAIADTTYYVSGDHGSTSICPTGWRLPQGNTASAGFSKLDVDLGGTGTNKSTTEASNRWRKYPNNFLYSGSFTSSSAYNRGSGGYYWSSTATYNYYSYSLYLYSSYISPGIDSSDKYYGQSIRCTTSF